jgi:hypothetical protein
MRRRETGRLGTDTTSVPTLDGTLEKESPRYPRLRYRVLFLSLWCAQRVGEGDMRDWVVPVKAGSDPFADPFEKAALEKKERVVRNKLAQAR